MVTEEEEDRSPTMVAEYDGKAHCHGVAGTMGFAGKASYVRESTYQPM